MAVSESGLLAWRVAGATYKAGKMPTFRDRLEAYPPFRPECPRHISHCMVTAQPSHSIARNCGFHVGFILGRDRKKLEFHLL